MIDLKGIQGLYYLQNTKQMTQFKIAMAIIAVAVFYLVLQWKAPFLFALACGGFFILPLFFLKSLSEVAKAATDSYNAGNNIKVNAVWQGECWSDNPTWRAHLTADDGRKWFIEVSRGGDTIDDVLKYPKMNGIVMEVDVWLHPKTNEPRLMSIEDKFFPILVAIDSKQKREE